mgnify:CR=1 FL=1
MTTAQKKHYETIGNELEEDDSIKLLLQEDIYALTFLQFIKTKTKLRPSLRKDFVLKCILTFIIQLSLSVLIFIDSDNAKPVIGNHQLNMTRFLCSVLLHLQILPEIKTSVEMMRYTVMQDPKAFNVVFPFLISLMKFIGGILTEVINGYKMSTAG